MECSKPVALIILDGWGFRDMIDGNAIAQAETPNLDSWRKKYECSLLQASGEAVGLTRDQMGNSEVGHLNIGAGRIVYQDISRIDHSIASGEFQKKQNLINAFLGPKQKQKRLHLFGLLGPGGVHSHTNHLYELIKMANSYEVTPIIHIITDGRDTPPNSAIEFVKELEDFVQKHPALIGSISGRYYAMDRDKRWERTQQAYDVYVHQKGPVASDASDVVKASYENNISDEFIKPTRISNNTQLNLSVQASDYLLFFNFRADRMRQIVRSFVQQNFTEFDRAGFIPDLNVLTFTEYEKDLPAEVLFPKENVTLPLAQVISENGLKQFHAAETEKYSHVTFFFNGGREVPFTGEERLLVQSPKVATYDLKPEMSAFELADSVITRIRNVKDDLIILNFANLDMVGHTGVLVAGIKAAEAVDECVGKVVQEIMKKNGIAIITADHGNAELMFDQIRKEPHTYHTTSMVQLFIISNKYMRLRPMGSLQDVAPTILDLMGLAKPDVMTGRSLIEETD